MDFETAFDSEWKKEFVPYPIMQYEGETGPTIDVPPNPNALTFFEFFWGDDIIELIVQNTNKYAVKTISAQANSTQEWDPVSKPEMKAYLGQSLLMGICRFPRQEDYWQTSCGYLKTGLATIFPKTRFEQITRFLHVADPDAELQRGMAGYDKLQKVGTITSFSKMK